MKNLILIIFGLLIICSSCSDDDNVIAHEITGKWHVIHFSCCEGFSYNYEAGDVIWDFKTDGIVNIEVNETMGIEASFISLFNSGNYEYIISGDSIIINNLDFGFEIMEDQLILQDSPESDGPYYEFER